MSDESEQSRLLREVYYELRTDLGRLSILLPEAERVRSIRNLQKLFRAWQLSKGKPD